MARSSAELGACDDEVDLVVSRSLTSWRTRLVEVLREAADDGAVRTDVDAQSLATTLLAYLRGLETLRKGGVRPGRIKASAEAALILVARAG